MRSDGFIFSGIVHVKEGFNELRNYDSPTQDQRKYRFLPPLPIPTGIYDTRMQKIAQALNPLNCVFVYSLHRFANENWPGAAPTQLVKANRAVFSLRNFTN